MVIIGAGGLAKELIDVLIKNDDYSKETLYFFDEIDHSKQSLFGFKILHTVDEVKQIFNQVSNEFCLGIGSPQARYDLYQKFENIGGKPSTIVSSSSIIANFEIQFGEGVCIMNSVTISNSVVISKGTLVNADVLLGHDVKIGEFSDIAPGVKITGHCKIGKYVSIGTGAVILPKVKIGSNSYIAAGTVVANDIPENSLVVGIMPSRVVKKLPDFKE